MAFRVEFTVRAARDLDSIFEYIKADESAAAADWFRGLEEAVSTLVEMPLRCPVAPESKKTKRALRHLLYGNKPHMYRVIYEVDKRSKLVRLIAIRHGAREPLLPDELI